MGFIDDYTTGINTYPDENVVIEIVDVDVNGGGALNTNDEGSFRVQVTNNGPLTLTDVVLKVEGLNGTKVKQNGAGSSYEQVFLTSSGVVEQLPAVTHNNTVVSTGSAFGFKAPARNMPVSDLIKITFEDWKPDFEHIHTSHTNERPTVTAVYRDNVLRS